MKRAAGVERRAHGSGSGSHGRRTPSGMRAAERARAAQGGQVLAPATLVLALAMGFAQASWAGAAVAPAGNLITPDGRTATTVAKLPGQLTNISTATVRAGVGYNSFGRFVVGAGNQVNLLVPANAGTLLNVVRDGAVDIEGVLRSYKNGVLGGDVVFADPDGLIVGRSGVVDVGGFTVVTPTSAVLEQLIGASGAIDGALSQRLLAGDVPLSADGSVLIQGRVQARDGVQIYAHDVLVAAAAAQAPSAAQHDALFQSTVNTQGLVQGGAIVASGGSIRIVAAQDATIDGTLSAAASKTSAGGVSVDAGRDLHLSGSISADGAPGVNAGAITLHAGHDIDVAASTVLSAAGAGAASDGGVISVKAEHDLQVASGTTLLAQAGSSGDAGRIELSAQDTATLGSLHVDLGAAAGKAGMLLIDPIDLVIDGSNDAPYTTDGGSVTLVASRSITVASGGVIDTEAAGGTSGGSISLSAPSISVQGGASLLAGTGAGAGSIQLIANATASTSAQISIGDASGQTAVLEGGDISLQATSNLAQSSYDHAVVSIQNADLTAYGTLGATAVASGGQQLTAIGAAASADVLASVRILGDANLSSSGAMNLSAQASATAQSTAALPVALSLPADAAAAVNQVSSVSTVEVGGSSTLSTTGTGSLLSLGASNTVSSDATADASGASAGASVAVNIVRVQTTAEIDGSASVQSAGDLQLSGTTTLAMNTAATASQGGASSTPDSGSQAAQYLADPSYTPYLSTSDGSVGAAAALAISDLQSATSVAMSSSRQATAAGQISLQGSAANAASAAADGSPAGDSTSKLGIGAAVALNLAHVSDDATVSQDLRAGSLDLSADMSGGVAGNTFSAQAVSGAGASNVGVAGSLATDLLDSEAEARVASGTVTLTGGSGALSLGSDDLSSSTVAALPEGSGGSGGKVGVGASVGLNIVATRSYAQLADGVSVSGAGAVNLDAQATHVLSTQADQGSAGGVSVTPVVALSLVNDQTQASIGALSGGLQSSGDVNVTAQQTAIEATQASGTAAGSKAAVGAALAVSVIDDGVVATTSTSVDATGSVAFSAGGVSESVAGATASASGGNASNSDGSAPSGEDSSVDAKIQKQSDGAETKAGDAGVGDASQQSEEASSSGSENGQGSTSDGSVAVAAAIAVDVADSSVQAYVPAAVGVRAGGSLSLSTVSNMDAGTQADASQVAGGDTSVGIGAAVAITLAHQSNDATLGSASALSAAPTAGGLTADQYQADSLSVSALQTDQGVASPALPGSSSAGPAAVDVTQGGVSGREDLYSASATSGAGASKVGVAGSLALDLVDSEAEARVASGAITLSGGSGALSLGSDDLSSSTVAALPEGAGASGGKVGVGASVGLNIVATRSYAQLDDGASVTGAGAVNLDAQATHVLSTQADQGSAGGVSVTPVVALSLVNDQTQASIGALSGGLQSSGDVNVTAQQTATEATQASGTAAGSKAAVGAALAVSVIDDGVVATTSTSIDATGSVAFSAGGVSESVAGATASASGGNASNSDGSAPSGEDSNVDAKVGKQSGSAETKASDAGVGDASQQSADKSASGSESGKGSTQEGAVAVAAAIAVDVADSSVQAYVPAAVGVRAGGSLSVSTVSNMDAGTQADGSQVAGGDTSVGIGAAVAITLAHQSNDATLGSASALSAAPTAGGLTADQYQADSLSLTALQTDQGVASPALPGSSSAGPAAVDVTQGGVSGREDLYSASATSGAGASKVGLAGSLAVNVIDSDSEATVQGGASLSLGGGALDVGAADLMSADASATPSGSGASGGKLGVGASVALNTITETSLAQIADGVDVSGTPSSLDVAADSVTDTSSTAQAGASGGVAVDAVVAMSLLDETTQASVGSGSAIDTSGGASISAASSGANTATAIASIDGSSGSNVAVGGSVAVITGPGILGASSGGSAITSTTSASLARDAAVGGALQIDASSSRTYDAESTASASGNAFSSAMQGGNDATAGGGSVASGDTLNTSQAQGAMNQGSGDAGQDQSKASGKSASQGKVSVAAAVGAVIAGDQVSASIVGGSSGAARTVSAASVQLTAVNHGDVFTEGDGATDTNSKVGIGVGVALSLVDDSSSAAVGDYTNLSSAGTVAVSATSTQNQDASFMAGRVAAVAMSGAAAGKVAVAGAIAVAASTSSTSASLGQHDTVQGPGASAAGAVSVLADNTSALGANAWSGSASRQGVGIGASIAVVISSDSYGASVGQDSNIDAAALQVSATNEKVDDPLSGITQLAGDVSAGAASDSSSFGSNVKTDAAAVQTQLQALAHNGLELALLGQSNYLAEAGAGAASGNSAAIAGGFAVQVIDNQVSAGIGAGTTVHSAGAVKVQAQDQTASRTLVGSAAASAGAAGVGVDGAFILDQSSIQATLGSGVDIASSASVDLQGSSAQDVELFQFSAGAADEAGVAGVIGLVTSQRDVAARVGAGSSIRSTGSVGVSAANDFSAVNLGGSLGVGGSAGVGATLIATTVDDSTTADIDSSTSSASSVDAGSVDVSAKSSENVVNVAVAGSAAGDVAISGVATPLTETLDTEASIGAGAGITSSGELQVDSGDASQVVNVGGAVGGAGSVGIGLTAAASTFVNTVSATVGAGSTISAGSLEVAAAGSVLADNIAVAGAVGGDVGVSGVLTPVTQDESVIASIGAGAQVTTTDAATGFVDVTATDTTQVFNLGGAVGGGAVGVGGSAAATVTDNTTRATIGDGAALSAAGAVDVAARASENIDTSVVAGAAGGVGVAVALGSSDIVDTTEAWIGYGANVSATAVTVQASDDSTISDLAGSAGVGGTGVGAGADVDVLVKHTHAWIGEEAPGASGAAADVTASSGDVGVIATSSENVSSVVAGAAVGGDAGAAGAVQTYVLTGDTEAAIGAGDTVNAWGNAGVVAADTDTLNAIVGAGALGGDAGIGASIGVSVADQTTLATIAGGASVTALGQGSSAQQATTGYRGSFSNLDAEGDPTTAAAAQTEGDDLTAYSRSISPDTVGVHGVVVNATATAALDAAAVSGAVGGGVGAAISGSVPVVISDTEAAIGSGARIDTSSALGSAAAAQSVAVAAASDLYVRGITGALGGGGAVGVGAGLLTNVIDNTTRADIASGSTVSAQSNVDVLASASEDFSGLAASAGLGGTVGVAGGATVLAVNDTTQALVDGTLHAGGSVVVAADDETRAAINSGSLAVGLTGAGVGAGIGVAVILKDTEATVGADAVVTALGQGSDAAFALLGAADSTATTAGQGLLVSANSGESLESIALAGAGGLYAGVAGAVSVQALSLKTLASIQGGASVNADNTGAAAAQAVDVVARDSSALSASDGAAGIGAAGVGGAVNVAVLTSDTGASIGDGASVNARGDVSVAAYANKAVSSNVYGVGGGIAGLGASIDVLAIANGSSAEQAQGSDSETVGQITTSSGGQSVGGNADSAVQNNSIGNDYLSQSSNANVRSASSSAQGAQDAVSASSVLGGSGVSGTSATIGNAAIDAGGSLAVQSDDRVDASANAGALGIGAVGIGAGVGVSLDSASNTASISGSSTLRAASIQVGADTHHSIGVDSKAGGAGLLAGADAVVAYSSDTSQTSAVVDGSTLLASGSTDIGASSERSLTSSGQGAALAGTVAAGASVAIAELGGGVDAQVSAATLGDSGSVAGGVNIGASSTDSAEADSVALSAGIGVALDGSVATADVHPAVTASFANGSIDSSGAVRLSGEADDSAAATASGGSLAIVGSAGASVATAAESPQVSADLGGSSVTAGSLGIDAGVGQSGSPMGVSATASGISGALFVGANASSASASNDASAIASAENSSLEVSGTVDVEGLLASDQNASATGVSAGLLALGADIAEASSSTTTKAVFNDMGRVSAGALTLNADGVDSNDANATAGSGGAFAGSAAVARTKSTADTVASIGNDTANPITVDVAGGAVDISATHTAKFSGWVDSTNAALVGASGAELDNKVDSSVSAVLGPDVQLTATDFRLDARNLVSNLFLNEGSSYIPGYDPDQGGWNVNSGSGGLINAPAGASTTDLSLATTATVGDGASVHLIAPADPTQVSTLFIEAYNDPLVQQRSQMDSGGAVALAEVATNITVNDTATVGIGSHSTLLVDVGDVEVGAWGDANLYGLAVATTYGVAGAPTGQAHINVDNTNLVSVGTDAEVQATDGLDPIDGSTPTHGTVLIAAGDSPTGTQSSLTLDSEVDLYNNTAIPIPTPPDAQSNVDSNALVVIAADPDQVTGALNPANDTHYGINAAGDINVSADQGALSTTANGTGTNIYLEALSKVASALSNLFGGGDISFTITGGSTSQTGNSAILADGLIDTGIQRDKTLTVDYAAQDTGTCQVASSACLAAPNPGDIGYTTTTIVPGGDILNRLAQLQALQVEYANDSIAVAAYQNEITFLETELVSLGMGSFDQSGTFHTNPDVAVPSQAAQQQLANDQQSFNTAISNLVTATSGLSGDDQAYAAALNTDVNDSSYGAVQLATQALSTIQGFANYASFVSIPSGQSSSQGSNDLAGVSAQKSAMQSDVSAIQADATNNASSQSDIGTQIATISAHAGSSATVSSAASSIDSDLSAINSSLSDENSKAASLKSSANTLYNDLSDLATNSKGSSDASTYSSLVAYTAPTSSGPATGGALGKLENGALQDISTQAANLSTDYTAEAAAYATLSASSSTAGSVAASIAAIEQDAAAIATDQSNIGSAGATSTVQQINVDPAVARLGDINLKAQVLSSDEGALAVQLQALVPSGLSLAASQGQLQAPGDARIIITNNTADPLALGTLTIPDYSYGIVRFNGTEVNTSQAIAALNAGGAASDFAGVTTAANTAAPTISITSNYNPTDAVYYNPNAAAGSPYYLTHQMMAPDLTLDSGAAITNRNGSVVILSAAGNIYQDGTIDAQSVSITARNGDFASSYINGIDSIAGDPSSQSPATTSGTCTPDITTGPCASQAGLGQGIIANGNVSIAARYLNINGLIQSGIVDNTLNIAAGDSLTTTDLASIGATAFQATIQGYVNHPGTGGPVTLSTDAQGNSLYVDPSNGQLEFSTAYANDFYAANKGNGGLNFSYSLLSPGSNISATYDAANQRYVVDSTEVHGGYIQLFGQMLDTSPTAGQLKVLDGFGTIDISNATNLPVVLSALSTGADASGTGRGTVGKIDITDVHLDPSVSDQVDVTHTVYTYDSTANNGLGQVSEARQSGTLNSDGTIDYTGAQTVTPTIGSTTSYAPLAGERYVWETASDNTVTTTFYTTSVDVFHSSSLATDNTTNWQGVSSSYGTPTLLPNGTFISTQQTTTSSSSIIYNGANGIQITDTPIPVTVQNTSLDTTGFVQTRNDYMTSSSLQLTGSESHCNWYTLCIASNSTNYYKLTQNYTEITTNSLKADYGIGVSFIGSPTGSIDVASAGNVVLTGTIANAAGTTSISAGTQSGNPVSSIVQGAPGARIRSKAIDLQASGSIGGVTDTVDLGAPVHGAVDIALAGGALSAVAGAHSGSGDVVISASGDLVVDKVSASVPGGHSSVSLSSDQSIGGLDSGSLVQADYVSLNAANGSIGGSGGGALTVDTGFTTDQNLRPFGDPAQDPSLVTTPYYGLSAQAAGDIDLSSASWADNAPGSMLVDSVVSTGGNVTLSAPGQILDNNPVQAVNQRTYQQLLDFWNSLALTAGNANTAKQQQTVSAYERSKTQEYEQYWAIRDSQPDGGAAYDPNFQVTFTAQQQAALLAQGLTQTQIDALAASQTSQYHQLDSEVGGLTASYVAGYRYQASSAEQAGLTQGATWTSNELSFAFSAAVLKTVTNTNDVVKAPNVAGRTVTLDAGTGVGETTQTGDGTNNQYGTVIDAGIAASALSDDQKVALASAEASDLQLTIAWAGGTTTVPLGTPYAQLDAAQQAALDAAAAGQASIAGSYLTILTKRALNVAASGSLDVAVSGAPGGSSPDQGNAYIASLGSLDLGSIDVTGQARIKVLGSLANAALSSIRTGDIILEGADGSIGSAADPLALSLLPGATITARAENGVYLATPGADAQVDTLYSPGTVALTAGGSILNATGTTSIQVLGNQVDLVSSTGSIGAAAAPLNVGVSSAAGSITADAATPGQSVWLEGPSGYDFVIGGIDSGASVSLQSAGDSTIAGAVDALGQVSLSAGGEQVFGSAGSVSTTAGGVTLAADSLKMLDGSGIDAAAGDIAIATTADALVTGLQSGSGDAAAVSIDAGGHVLAGTAPGRTDIAADAPGAGIDIQAGLGIGDETEADTEAADAPGEAPGTANRVSAVPNPLILRTGNLTLSSARGDIDVVTTAPVASGSVSAQDGSVDLQALQDLTLAGIAAPLGGVTVRGDGAVTLGTVSSGGSQLLHAAGQLDLGSLVTTGLPGDPGNIVLLSSGAGIQVASVNGHAGLSASAQGAIDFGALSIQGALGLSSQTSLNLPVITVGSGSSFAAPTIDIAGIIPAAGSAVPFELDLGGPQGSVGLSASVSIDTTLPVVIASLREGRADIVSNSADFRILDGYILQEMLLRLPDQTLDLNSLSPRPAGPQVVSIFNPGLSFQLTQLGNLTITNAFLVNNTSSSQLDYLLGQGMIQNQNFVDDFVRGLRNGDADPLAGDSGQGLGGWFSPLLAPPSFGSAFGFAWPSQPAVNLEQPGTSPSLRRRHGALLLSSL